MGLASFNRMRRQQKPSAIAEAERFKEHHLARNQARDAKRKAHTENRKRVDEIRELDKAAMQRIGELNVEGLDNNDVPMRREHAAEIVGRNLEGVQTPKDPVARVEERLPEGTSNEELVDQMLVSGPGPDQNTLQAAREEAGVPDPVAAKLDRGPRRDRDPDNQTDRAAARERRRTERERRASTETTERAPRRRRELSADDRAAELTARSAVEIPANWRDMGWGKKRGIAAKVSDSPVNTKADADAAIEAELRRRG